uniref:Uncharacterized protein n=1 Tax=Canis lupus familiaris TaxID=9615 RepID=A0A8C0RM32_CANLF
MVFKLAQAYYDLTRRQNPQASEQNQKKYAYHTQDEEDDREEDEVEEEKEERIQRRRGKEHEQTPDSSRHEGSHDTKGANFGHSDSGSHHCQPSTQTNRSRQTQSRQGKSSSEFRSVKNWESSINQDSDSEGHTEDSERQYGSESTHRQSDSGTRRRHGSTQGNSTHTYRQSGRRGRQENKQRQSGDGSTHSETGHRKQYSGLRAGTQRGSSTEHTSDNEGHLIDSNTDFTKHHRKSGKTSGKEQSQNYIFLSLENYMTKC